MTTPNIEELVTYLRGFFIDENMTAVKANRIADTVQAQAERIKALELDLDVQAGSIEAVQAVNARQAERIKELEAEIITRASYGDEQTDFAIKLAAERDALRARLAAISATEPHYWEYKGSLYQSKVNDECEELFTRPMPAGVSELVGASKSIIAATEPVARAVADKTNTGFVYVRVLADELLFGTELFTHPMPAQDVTGLVEALEKLARLGNGDQYGNSDGNMIARTALTKHKGAK